MKRFTLIALIGLLFSSVCLGQQQGNYTSGINSPSAFDTNMLKTRKEVKQLDKQSGIKVMISSYLDNRLTTIDEDFVLTVKNVYTNAQVVIPTIGKFTLYLAFDREYIIQIAHKGYETKQLVINTVCPYENWEIDTQIRFKKGVEKVSMVGRLAYNDSLQTFKGIVYK